jgi:ceramide glucosyltransferase
MNLPQYQYHLNYLNIYETCVVLIKDAVMILYFLLAVAVFGTVTSTIVLILAVAGAVQFRRNAKLERKAYEKVYAELPPASVLKPVHGNEARLKENIESFFNQKYPKYEILFAADEEDDAALPVIREICARYPHIPTRILVTGPPPWPNAQNYCFHRMSEAAAYDILVTSDSDVEVEPDYLRDVVAPLLDPEVGAVTCVFRGKSAGGVWADLDAMGQSVEFAAGVLTVNLLEGTKFGLGPTIAVRKDSLARIGGSRPSGSICRMTSPWAISSIMRVTGSYCRAVWSIMYLSPGLLGRCGNGSCAGRWELDIRVQPAILEPY